MKSALRVLLSIALLAVVQPAAIWRAAPAYAASLGAYYGIAAWPDGDLVFGSPGDVAIDGAGSVLVVDTQNNRIKKLSSAGVLQEVWGERGTGAGQFRGPQGVAVSSAGVVYVADTGNSRVQVFDATGSHLATWGGPGAADGEFANPVGIAVDAAGNVYVSDTGNSRIQKFSSAGAHIATWGEYGSANGQLSGARGLTVDAGGYIYVVDANNLRIQKFNSSGAYVAQWGPYDTGGGIYGSRYVAPYGITVDGSGSLYIADAGGSVIEKCTSTGIEQATWGALGSGAGQFDTPKGVAVGSGGDVYVADSGNSRIEALDATGAWVASWSGGGSGPGELDHPDDAVISSAGFTYVADVGNDRVQILDANGAYVAEWGATGAGAGQFSSPSGIAMGASATVFVADTGNHRIQSFDASGTHVATFGGSGTAPGQFASPEGLTVDAAGTVLVADTGNNRVQRLSAAGVPLGQWGSPGTGAGEFNVPADVAVDSDGDVFVVERDNNRVQKFSSTGAYLLTWGGYGADDGKFKAPDGIAVDSGGDVYVADRGNQRIQRFTGDGVFVAEFATLGAGLGEVNDPVGIDVAADGHILVTERGNHRVQVFGYDDVAPVTTAYGVSAGFVNTPVTVTLIASDNAAGVASTLYKIVPPGELVSSAVEVAYTGPFTVSYEGDTRVYYRSIDSVGNEEVASLARVRIDSTPPAGTFTLGDDSGYSTTSTVAMTSSVTDAVEMRIDTGSGYGSWTSVASVTTLTLPGDGAYTIKAQYRDSLTNTLSLEGDITVDSVAPVTTISGVPSVWATSSVTVTLDATDGTAGVEDTFFRIDGGGDQVYSSAFVISDEGTTTISYRSVDRATNAEEWRDAVVRIDTIPPTGSLVLDGGAATTTTETVTANSSVVGALEMRFDTGAGSGFDAWRAYADTETLSLPGEAAHTVTAQYRDKAGLVFTATDSIIVDHTAPLTTVTGVPADWTNDPVTVTLTSVDTVAGVDSIRYSLNDGPEQVVSGGVASFMVTTEGTTTVSFFAVDNAGNAEATSTVVVRIDTIRPWGTFMIGGGAPYSRTESVDLISDMQAAVGMRFDISGVLGTWRSYDSTESTVLSGEGEHVVTAEYRNNAGLVTTRTASVIVDHTAPVTTADVVASYVTTATIALDASDAVAGTAVSGVSATYYRVDAGAWLTYVAPIRVTQVGAHTVEYYSKDAAGNQELVVMEPFVVERATYTPVSLMGASRYETAIAVAEECFPQGASTVIIATGHNWPDALGGAALAGAYDAPILLTATDSLPAGVADAIVRLGADSALILGGTGAVSSAVQAELDDLLTGEVRRIGGADRYETGHLIAQEVIARAGDAYDGTALVTTGANFPDALAGSPLAVANGWPIYLARPGAEPGELVSQMRVDGVFDALVLGGGNAVSDGYLTALDTGLDGSAIRISGEDRYETGVTVAAYGVSRGLVWDGVAIATGRDFADAMVGGVLSGKRGSVMLLTRSTSLPVAVADTFRVNRDSIINVHFLGGEQAIGAEVRNEVGSILQ